ncbi:hypothetical protein CEQ21_18105 [Niallia circulans]|uniref:Uncharacterized protein n=1 Tax=Niallia circulans TaxID=1397 RepID=A0A553SK57_NIACI|nr:hypothetical protein CEQ21_18105 [Niallia circulans]
MKSTIKYLTVLVWAVLFLYTYSLIMPKNAPNLIIGILLLIVSILFIMRLFEGKKKDHSY